MLIESGKEGPSVNLTEGQTVVKVGDKYFGIPTEALSRHRESLFGEVEAAAARADRSVVTLPRSPAHFPFILAYLLSGLDAPAVQRAATASPLLLEQLLREALFYRLPELAAYLKALLKVCVSSSLSHFLFFFFFFFFLLLQLSYLAFSVCFSLFLSLA